MKILVTGREGQVVRSLVERARPLGNVGVVAVGRPALDLTEPASIAREIERHRPDIVVSAAAYTAVDASEDDLDLAMRINADGAGAVARAAAMIDAPIIHLSTDYVFSGDSARPYVEDDVPGPKTAYGSSKLAGEQTVAAANPQHVILRTAWVYSPFGRNFVRTMLGLAMERDEISVVSDQWGNPTSALDIADGILHIAARLDQTRDPQSFGIFHLAGTGSTNWSGLAEQVFSYSRALGGPWAQASQVPASSYPSKAPRPVNSRLNTDKLDRIYNWRAPQWRDSCAEVVRRLVVKGARQGWAPA